MTSTSRTATAVVFFVVGVALFLDEANSSAIPFVIEERHPVSAVDSNNQVAPKSSVPLSGSLYQRLYIVQLKVGFQWFNLQIDTGSTVTSVAANRSKTKSETPYFPSLSPSAHPLHCNSYCAAAAGCTNVKPSAYGAALPPLCSAELHYADGASIGGSQWSDRVQLGGGSSQQKQARAVIVAAHQRSSHFKSRGIDGILGLAYRALDGRNGDDVWSQIHRANRHTLRNMFSICVGDRGGLLTLGAQALDIGSRRFRYTPLVSLDFYSVAIARVTLDDAIPVDVAWGQTFLDSGATLINLQSPVYRAFAGAFQRHFGNLSHISGAQNMFDHDRRHECFTMSQEDVDRMPTITFQFGGGGAEVRLAPDVYMLRCDSRTFRLGIDESPKGTGNVLGDVFLQSVVTLFDRENARIGFTAVPEDGCIQTSTDYPDLKSISPLGLRAVVGQPLSIMLRLEPAPVQEGYITKWKLLDRFYPLAYSTYVPSGHNGTVTAQMVPMRQGTFSVSVVVPGPHQFVYHVHVEASAGGIAERPDGTKGAEAALLSFAGGAIIATLLTFAALLKKERKS